jgi:hypothetical protein
MYLDLPRNRLLYHFYNLALVYVTNFINALFVLTETFQQCCYIAVANENIMKFTTTATGKT